jgi:hypothetical protein
MIQYPTVCWQLLRGIVDLEDQCLSLVSTARRPLIVQKIVLKNFQKNWLNFMHVVLLVVVVLDLHPEAQWQLVLHLHLLHHHHGFLTQGPPFM